MNIKLLLGALLLGPLVISAGCKPGSDEQVVQRNWVSVPALPIIQDAVSSLEPTFSGKRDASLMSQVCGLARGELTQKQVDDNLRKAGIKLDEKAKDATVLLYNGDKAGQATACAAYLATAVLQPVDAREFMKSMAKPKEEGKPAQPTLQLDPARLRQMLPIKVAEAKANGDVFALIATELQRRPGLTVAEYRKQAVELFARLAPQYLQRIKDQLPPRGAIYRLKRLDAERFAFGSSLGAYFEYGIDSGLVFKQNGLTWYGDGKLLGQEYPLQVDYFPEAVIPGNQRGNGVL
ncbi:hypothetical protein NNO07_10005 [Pseudomonas resinovorans]|uniref:Lipoprotein n=1 Tax=Metapseudomonas resinovorans TaxID=53412 RepID=A0ABT4Y3I9_METRE|nr:hypothetical protein [Pseudomonas resinovorans]MDA8483402.1 hypothetical protein [Pseudomonas resinovorans]